MTTIININNSEDYDIYIGRGSIWGNPFKIGKDGTRQQVIEKYEEYIRKNSELLQKLSFLEGKKLGCYCSPKPCHGDVLIKLLKERQGSKIIEQFFD